MRTFVISDVHGHPELIRAAFSHGGFQPGRDRFVFGGDFLDRGKEARSCLDLIALYADEVLLGNHDVAVLLDTPVYPQEPDSPRFRPQLTEMVLHPDPGRAWKVTTAVEGVLVSHAGICARYGRVFRETCGGEPSLFAETLNAAFRDLVRARLGIVEGDRAQDAGADELGLLGDYGPFWFRPPPWTHARPLSGVTQIAGHSPAMADLAKEGFHMIDPGVWLADFGESLMFRYAVIEDGEVRVEEGQMGGAGIPDGSSLQDLEGQGS